MFCFVILSDAKNLSNVSCKVPVRDPSDTTFCQDDKTSVLFLKLWSSSPLVVYFSSKRSGRRRRVRSMDCWNSHSLIFASCPESNTSGTRHPL